MIDRVMAQKRVGRTWLLRGEIQKGKLIIKTVDKVVEASSEEELESAERELRSALAEEAFQNFKKGDLKDIKIEVRSEIDKSDRP
jgi:hypothetical protein